MVHPLSGIGTGRNGRWRDLMDDKDQREQGDTELGSDETGDW